MPKRTSTPAALIRLGLVASTILGTSSAALAASDEEPRVTRSADGFERDRAEAELRDSAQLVDSITVPGRLSPEATSELATVSSSEAWIYDATVSLFNDFDGDGYHHYIRVRFDADSLFDSHYVYARLYLSEDGEYWEEYHVTGDILIEGSSPFDDFEVETELVSGFPPGLYDVLIELYDADFGDYLDEFGPAQSSALSLLPLEDRSFDHAPPVIVVTEEHGGGGSADWLLVAALLAGVIGMRAAREPRARTAPVANRRIRGRTPSRRSTHTKP
jgi:hypothetical protein